MRILAIFLVLFCLCIDSGNASVEKSRQLQFDKLASMTSTQAGSGSQRFSFDYGGWFNYRYDNYHNSDNDSSVKDLLDDESSYDLRLWGRLKYSLPFTVNGIEPEILVYVRGKHLFSDLRPEGSGGYDSDGPHIDYLYTNISYDQKVIFSVGRNYYRLGRGIAFSGVFDAVQVEVNAGQWNLIGLMGNDLPHEENIDLSVPGYDKSSDRYYGGIQLSYTDNSGKRTYVYGLLQKDCSDERPEDPLHDYTYDTQHFGLGSEGFLADLLYYWAEAVVQTGQGRKYDSSQRSDIFAFAVNMGLEYSLPKLDGSNLIFEYGMGSGDSERDSVTDTDGGNISGYDYGFSYIGYVPTGSVIVPRLSNLHFFRAGLKHYPFKNIRYVDNMSISLDYYHFLKVQSSGAVSDAEANANAHNVGGEVDLVFEWEIFSDLSVTLEYGHFFAGNAYASNANDDESYFSVSTVVTF